MAITLSSQAVRRTALAGATVALSITVAACGASFNAQTSKPYQPAEGTNAQSGGIAVRNLLVLASEDGKGELHGVIVNSGQSDDKLVSIASAPADAQVASTEQPATVTIGGLKEADLKAGDAFTIPPSSNQPVTVTGGKPGQMIKVTITFGKAGPITTSIPVLTTDHYSPSPRPDAESHS
ncbi:copper chaperone PCu(A)C [Streptomyces sp. SID13031]|uniref:copper chaperone PCu(A)C n=1 Tax=Streptomyces sp. SID13031 TaxID=2706046 RepID=UPI0013CB0D4E|nr:copper chaperone PCu(A)C [Streptomyces sp. SID13031]NEA31821.1 copper chaperone PCu(A)C [Streptomyces sp. SID13031]